jgi:hypothetical protein
VLLYLMVLVCGLVGALTSSPGSIDSSVFESTSTAVSRTNTAALMAGSAGNNGSGVMQLGAAAFTCSGNASPLTQSAANSTAVGVISPSQEPAVVLSVAGICPVAALQFVLAGQPYSTAGTFPKAPSTAPTVPDCRVECGVTAWNATAPTVANSAVAGEQFLQCPSHAVLLDRSWGKMRAALAPAYSAINSSEANSTLLQAPPVNLTWQTQHHLEQELPAAIQLLQAAPADNAAKVHEESCRRLSPSEEGAVRVVGLLGSVASQVRVELAVGSGGGHRGCHIMLC